MSMMYINYKYQVKKTNKKTILLDLYSEKLKMFKIISVNTSILLI